MIRIKISAYRLAPSSKSGSVQYHSAPENSCIPTSDQATIMKSMKRKRVVIERIEITNATKLCMAFAVPVSVPRDRVWRAVMG